MKKHFKVFFNFIKRLANIVVRMFVKHEIVDRLGSVPDEDDDHEIKGGK